MDEIRVEKFHRIPGDYCQVFQIILYFIEFLNNEKDKREIYEILC